MVKIGWFSIVIFYDSNFTTPFFVIGSPCGGSIGCTADSHMAIGASRHMYPWENAKSRAEARRIKIVFFHGGSLACIGKKAKELLLWKRQKVRYKISSSRNAARPTRWGVNLFPFLRTERLQKGKDLEVFFITFDEPLKEGSWQNILETLPHAKRVDNVKGFDQLIKSVPTRSKEKDLSLSMATTSCYLNSMNFSFPKNY